MRWLLLEGFWNDFCLPFHFDLFTQILLMYMKVEQINHSYSLTQNFFLGNVVLDIDSGDWMKREFKPYNFNALGQPTEGGHLHPLMKAMLNTHTLSFRI